ncbi:hypothetical protein ACVIQY_004798 [Bradyrhizobium sp. USDA 3051]
MKSTMFINLEPYEWRQSLRGDETKKYAGRGMQLSARMTDVRDIELLNTDEKLGDIIAHIGIHSGEPTMGDGKPLEAGIGLFVFNERRPSDEYSEAMIIGWFCLAPEDYDEVWRQVADDNYTSCTVTLEVGPMQHKGAGWAWDVKRESKLYVDNGQLYFIHSRAKKEEPQPARKRGLFG